MNRYFVKQLNKLAEMIDDVDGDYRGSNFTPIRMRKNASVYEVAQFYRVKYASEFFSTDKVDSDYRAGKKQFVGETLFQALFALYKATETLFEAVETSNEETKAATVPLERIDISTTTAGTHMGNIGLNANQLMIMVYEGSVTPSEVKRRLDNIRKNFKTVSEIVKGFNDPLSFMDSKDIGAGMAAFRKLSPALDAFDRVLTAAEQALSSFKPKPKPMPAAKPPAAKSTVTPYKPYSLEDDPVEQAKIKILSDMDIYGYDLDSYPIDPGDTAQQSSVKQQALQELKKEEEESSGEYELAGGD